jgi:hypothetical protein
VQINGSTTMFESYGFINASFYDADNPAVKLQVASGKTVTMSAPIPYGLQENAPETIPLWYYDEEDGLWREEGSATKQGDSYVGSVSHFTFWNFDHPVTISDQATLTGTVMAADRSEPIAGAQVVASGVNYAGYTTAYTNADGEFVITVKADAQVKLQAFAGSNASNQTGAINTPDGGGTASVDNLIIQDRSFTIMGRLVGLDGNPIPGGYGQLNQLNLAEGEMGFTAWINLDEQGNFRMNTQNFGNDNTFNVMFTLHTRGSLFSSSIPFLVPQPGNIWDFGVVTMRPGGQLSGRARKSDGTYFSNTWINFSQEGAQGEGSYFSAEVDEDGNFTVEGPPNTNLSNMRGMIYIESTQFRSAAMTLRFPASGAERNPFQRVFRPEAVVLTSVPDPPTTDMLTTRFNGFSEQRRWF